MTIEFEAAIELVAPRDILRSDGAGPAVGTLIMTRNADTSPFPESQKF